MSGPGLPARSPSRGTPSPIAGPPRFYFPELDGLRFIAFLLVFIHHTPRLDLPGWAFVASHGWIGVDLFFALSAFLFVKILAKEYDQTGTISIPKFYIRRGLRIWPIYAIFCVLLTILNSMSMKVHVLLWRVLGLFTFTDNLVSACKGYNPMAYSAHLWTISYEEQFYLFIPLLLLFLFKSSRSRVVTSLSVIAVLFASCRAVLIWMKVPHPAIWVLPVTHFESILLGIVVGLGGFDAILSRVPAVLTLMGGLVAGWLMTRMGSVEIINWNLMISYGLIGLSTSLVLYFVFRTGKTRCMKWLSFGPFVFLGKVSYGLYVYHVLGVALGVWVVRNLLLRARFPQLEPAAIFVVSLGITVSIASASYVYVEKPFLRLKKRYEVVASRPA